MVSFFWSFFFFLFLLTPEKYAGVWVPAEGQGSDGTGIRRGGGTRSTAIRTVEAGSICLELSIEENYQNEDGV